MNIQVYPHRIILNKTNEVNSGEYNVNECTFEFSQEYEGLTKVAVFSLCDGTTKNVTILNNQCIIPVECLQETGQVQIGVYGYATQDNELVLRYSPTPQNFVVRLGSYKEGTQPVAPTPTDWEILVEQVSDIAEDVSSIHEDITGINGEISGINIDIRDLQDTKANISDLAEVAFTGEFSDLKNIPSYATTQQLNQEIQDRQDADVNLQSQIDAISVSSDVVDVVGTYQELLDYDTTHLKDNDIVKVLQDSTHSDALSYYRWDKETSTWSYVGSEGPFYTKSETDALLNDKQDVIDIDNMLSSDFVDDTNSTNKFVTQADITNWNNKEDKSNKVTEINSSSTDTQYPSAKCVYDSQEEQNEQLAELEMLYNAFPTVSDEDTTIQLDNTAKVKFREIDLKGNTSQVVIPEEQGTSVSNTSIYVSDVNTDKENTIEISGNTYQANAILPSEYTQVDYIESDGNQYIDTGVNPTDTTNIETKVKINDITQNRNYVCGCYSTNTTNRFQISFLGDVANYNLMWCRGTQVTRALLTLDVNNIYEIKTNGDTLTINNQQVIASGTFDTQSKSIYLFGNNSNGTVSSLANGEKIYYFKIYNNNVLVRDFIPCFRNTDNEVGLYDLINNVFYTNQGTGVFTYGSVSSIPNPDYPQNIEVVTGTQNVEVCGKNLNNGIDYKFYIGTTGTTYRVSGNDKGLCIEVNGESSYTISTTTTQNRYRVACCNSLPTTTEQRCYNGTNKDGTSNNITINTSGYKYLLVNATDLTAIQIEKGSTATTYEAYQGTTYPVNLGNIELCKIDTYQDRIYKSNNKWYLYKETNKVIVDGTNIAISERRMLQLQGKYAFILFFSKKAKRTAKNLTIGGFCNMLNEETRDAMWPGVQGFSYGGESDYWGDISIYTNEWAEKTVQQVNAELSSNNIELVYILDTPITTEITDTTLVNQLNALYNATIYPITNINTDTSNLLPYIDLHYNFVTPSPSPSRPSQVNLVKGNNTITISNSDNTESQVFPINLGNIELCKIGTYQDYIYESNGNWFKKSNIGKIALNGSEENWARGTIQDYYRYTLSLDTLVSADAVLIYSNYYRGITYNNRNSDYFNTIYANGNIGINTNVASTLTEWKSWLSNNNLIAYYVLVTPTDTQITDTTLITQLNNIKKAYSYDIQTNISQTNADKPFIIYAEAIRSLKDVFE